MQDKNQADVKSMLNELAKHLNVKGVRGLAKELGEAEGKLYAWVKRGAIGDTGSILSKCPTVSKRWLETGEGDMIRKGNTGAAAFEHPLVSEQGEDYKQLDIGNMTIEQKLRWIGLNARQIRTLQELDKMEEEEQDEQLKKLTIKNLEKGRY